ncbi:MAG: NAD-dependent epimerase/dehydratase family protein [Firmicutes bacterium]|nr:NAD-dependent epimerase/dehydratase family protein [Bacillota bacterium]MDD6695402.1 NAD-dependent epimerase/dehydratase family protein [Bacillota bacterium]MDY3769440.1 NAD-dependent epimerase/dehydratase family protein [Lachnospiraceae bacterium]
MQLHHVVQEDIDRILKEPIAWETMKGKKVLISGVNGLIAAYLVRTMLVLNDTKDYGIQIYGIARNEQKTRDKWKEILERDDFHLVIQDVTKPVELSEEIDIIIHAASQTGPNQFVADPVGTAMGNVLGAYQLLEYGRIHGTQKFLLLSTREIYGRGSLDFVTEEDYGSVDPTSVRSCYPEGKRMAENLCACYKSQYGIDCKIARIAHTYGPGMLLSDGRVVGDFLGNVKNREDIVMNSDGSGTLALTYIGDVVAGLFYTLLQFKEMVYNVSNSEETVTVKQLAETLCDIFADRGIKLVMHIPKGEKSAGYLSYKLGFLKSDKAMAEGWEPKICLRDGMKRTMESYE